MNNTMNVRLGMWVRAYTTALRHPTASTILGKVVQFGTVKDPWTHKPIAVSAIIKNLSYSVEVPLDYVIGEVDVAPICADLGVPIPDIPVLK